MVQTDSEISLLVSSKKIIQKPNVAEVLAEVNEIIAW